MKNVMERGLLTKEQKIKKILILTAVCGLISMSSIFAIYLLTIESSISGQILSGEGFSIISTFETFVLDVSNSSVNYTDELIFNNVDGEIPLMFNEITNVTLVDPNCNDEDFVLKYLDNYGTELINGMNFTATNGLNNLTFNLEVLENACPFNVTSEITLIA